MNLYLEFNGLWLRFLFLLQILLCCDNKICFSLYQLPYMSWGNILCVISKEFWQIKLMNVIFRLKLKYNQQHCLNLLYNVMFLVFQDTKEQLYDMVPMIPTIETISVVCLTEDQEDGDLILDLMVDGINMVSLVILLHCKLYLFSHISHE